MAYTPALKFGSQLVRYLGPDRAPSYDGPIDRPSYWTVVPQLFAFGWIPSLAFHSSSAN